MLERRGTLAPRDTGRTVKERLRNPGDDFWRCSEFGLRELSPDVFLLTYVLEQGARRALRTTIWGRHAGEWRAEFHQGTIAPAAS